MDNLKEKINEQFVYLFNEAKWIGKEILWWKWHGLVEMVSLWLTIPEGFVITTKTCKMYSENNIPIIKRFSPLIDNIFREQVNIPFLCLKNLNYFSTGRKKLV